ncbi:MAG: GHKL domain-containing protein [Selenomonadaceae bacterium]|nr:GHKL domain-containing protein [Selenomonadaceae bacterium]
MIFMGIALTTIQLSSCYLRYLPFSKDLSDEIISRLVKSFLLWGLVGLAINFYIFSDGVTYRAFKTSFLISWFPYFLISIAIIRKKFPQHIFILGMQMLWCFTLHAFSGMVVTLIYGNMAEELLPLQSVVYLGLFTILFRVEQNFFTNLLPTAKLFGNDSTRWMISLLPMMIFFGATTSISDVTFFPTWREKFSHVFLPICFFIIYRSLSIATQQVEEKNLQEQQNRTLQRQMESMSEHNALMEKSHLEVATLRGNLEKNYFKIEKFLLEGKKSEAMEFIRRQTHLLETTRVKTFCLSPLINAALSIHFNRAEKLGIKINHKIDLPAKITTNESDLAVLVSNLLENAITASKKNSSAREISLIMRNIGGQNALEISNRYDFPIKIGENGLPYTTKIGHGLGMSSLEIFAKKYNAFVDFSHENKIVRLNLYWND